MTQDASNYLRRDAFFCRKSLMFSIAYRIEGVRALLAPTNQIEKASMAAKKSTPADFAWWRSVMTDHQKSGLTAKEFCRRRDINEKTFSSWKKRLSSNDDAIQIKPVPSPSNHSECFESPMVVNATLQNGLLAKIECTNHFAFDSTLRVLNSL